MANMTPLPREEHPELEEGPPPERRERRALSHVGGRVDLRGGDEELRGALEAALGLTGRASAAEG